MKTKNQKYPVKAQPTDKTEEAWWYGNNAGIEIVLQRIGTREEGFRAQFHHVKISRTRLENYLKQQKPKKRARK